MRSFLLAPVLGLGQHWQTKLPVAFGVAIAAEIAEIYAGLLQVNAALLLLCFTLVVVDLLTGVVASLRRHERVSSRDLRRTGWKAIEYSALGFCGVLLSNGFDGTFVEPITAGFDEACLFYIAMTEFVSIIENVTGSRENAIRLLRRIRRVWSDQDGSVVYEEVIRPLDAEPESARLSRRERFRRSAARQRPLPVLIAGALGALLLLAACGSTETITTSAEIERPTAVHVGPVDTLAVGELAPLPPADRPGAQASLPLAVTEATRPDTTSAFVELLGLEVFAETIRARTRVAGLVQEQTFRNVRSPGQTQTLRPDSSGRLSADVAGEASPERVEVEVTVPRETPLHRRWWFGPALLLGLALLGIGTLTLRRLLLVLVVLVGTVGIVPIPAATAQPSAPHRDGLQRATIVTATGLSGFATGFSLGWRDGIANDARIALSDDDPAASLAANHAWHRIGYITKPLLMLDVGGALAIGGLVEPSLTETLLLAASWGASLGIGFHLGHNAQQGQRWDYFGTVDPSDQWAKALGPTAVTAAAIVVAGGLLYFTYEVLR